MSLDRFVRDRRPVWDRLSATVDRVMRRGARRIDSAALEEMVHLYREVSADLARLRALEAEAWLVEEINRLVTRAHGQIYRRVKRKSNTILSFLLVDYPRLFRATWQFTAASFLLSAVFAVLAYHSVKDDPEVVANILGPYAASELYGEKTGEDIRERFRILPFSMLSSQVTTNNIMVALNAFALGITFGVGTVYMLIVNGTMLGGFTAAFARSGAGWDFWRTILPHGALELSAIVIAGASGLMVGYALWCPGRRTRGRALREEAAKAVLLAVGLIPAFVVAGIFEGFVTPNDAIPETLKVVLGVLVAVCFWAHLVLGGRRSQDPSDPTTSALHRRGNGATFRIAADA